MTAANPGTRLTQQIELSLKQAWSPDYYTHADAFVEDIPASASGSVLRLLRQHEQTSARKKQEPDETGWLYIDPMSLEIGIWNFVVIFCAYFLQLQISLTLAFGPVFWDNELQHTIYYFGYVGLLIVLLIDVGVNFKKGYYAFGSGRIIEDKRKIARNYLRLHFFVDVVSIIFLLIPLIHSDYVLNFLQLIPACLLFVKKFKCQSEIVRSLEYWRNARYTFILFMLGCDVMLLGNFGACIFLGLDLLLWRLQFFGNNPQYYWLSNNSSYSVDLIGGPWIAQYVYAQSFSTGTLSTLAPGPFGKNPIEISYELFVMIFFMLLASYVGEVLISILYSREQLRIFHENNIQKFDNFMRLKQVSSSIKRRIQNFFELIWQFEIKMNTEKQQQIIQSMPKFLKQELVIQMGFAKLMNFANFFTLRSELQRIISFKIQSSILDPAATIFEIGPPLDAVGEGHVYFFKNGLVKMSFPTLPKETILSLSNSKKIAGEYEFVTGLSFAYCCQSIDLCILERIRTSELLEIIDNLELRQQFQVLKCKLMLYGQLREIGYTCLVCLDYHRQNQCPHVITSRALKEPIEQAQNIGVLHQKPHSRTSKHRRSSFRPSKCRVHLGKAVSVCVSAPIECDEVYLYSTYYADFNIFL